MKLLRSNHEGKQKELCEKLDARDIMKLIETKKLPFHYV